MGSRLERRRGRLGSARGAWGNHTGGSWSRCCTRGYITCNIGTRDATPAVALLLPLLLMLPLLLLLLLLLVLVPPLLRCRRW
jgi:hypothetical protein